MCGNNLYYNETLSLYKRFGFSDLNQITRVAYRDGAHPGNFVVQEKNGKRGTIDKFTFNYLSFFYTPFRCLSCIDQTNELADVSIGDAWRGTYNEKDKKGRSVIIVRNSNLVSLLKEGKDESRYELQKTSLQEAIRMHANVLDNKKVGAFARMNIWRKIGKEVPNYSLNARKISLKRYCFEAANLVFLYACSLNVSRDVATKIPLKLLSPLLKFIRGTWRKEAAKKFDIGNKS